MPWVRRGRTVYKRTDGLKKKLKAGSAKKAKSAIRLLHGVKRGWKPSR